MQAKSAAHFRTAIQDLKPGIEDFRGVIDDLRKEVAALEISPTLTPSDSTVRFEI